MKIQILDTEGKKTREITTSLFEEPVREDIICKVVEAEKIWQPYASKYRAGMDRSASGLQRKRRHRWKSNRGRGLSRIPRKVMSRRGTQFNWIGAIVPGTRGGRKAHPPKGSVNLKKINKKEFLKALLSALTLTSRAEELQKKYTRLKNKKIDTKLPLVVESKILEFKTKEFFDSLKKILGELYEVGIQKKTTRAGKGKLRGRKYKKNAGLLFVTGKREDLKVKGVEIIKANQLTVSDLASNGARLTLFTENAIQELQQIKEKK
jgi:large subunit ribosomal protein L4e